MINRDRVRTFTPRVVLGLVFPSDRPAVLAKFGFGVETSLRKFPEPRKKKNRIGRWKAYTSFYLYRLTQFH